MDDDFLHRANTKRNEYLLMTEELFTANKPDGLQASPRAFGTSALKYGNGRKVRDCRPYPFWNTPCYIPIS